MQRIGQRRTREPSCAWLRSIWGEQRRARGDPGEHGIAGSGASSLGSDARRRLKDHPTVKPTALPEDALLDVSNRGEIVIDPFLGSGSTLIAAEATGRVCRGVELDPLYRPTL